MLSHGPGSVMAERNSAWRTEWWWGSQHLFRPQSRAQWEEGVAETAPGGGVRNPLPLEEQWRECGCGQATRGALGPPRKPSSSSSMSVLSVCSDFEAVD